MRTPEPSTAIPSSSSSPSPAAAHGPAPAAGGNAGGGPLPHPREAVRGWRKARRDPVRERLGRRIDARKRCRNGSQLIAGAQPTLIVCAYHLQDHLWKIPLLIHSISPDYKFYLRAHGQSWETVCYAVPA